jgi:hypothetical protein
VYINFTHTFVPNKENFNSIRKMGAAFILGIIFALILLAVFASGAGWFAYHNKKKSDASMLYPFSATVGPDGQATSFSTINPNTGATVNQITCPTGTSVNIIGAISQVSDPFGMCLAGPGQTNPQLQGSALASTCGLTGTNTIPTPVQTSIACSPSSTCPPGMNCVGGRCQLQVFDCNGKGSKLCSTNSVCSQYNASGSYQCVDVETGGVCTQDTSKGMCIETNICFSSSYSGQPPLVLDSNVMNPNGNWMCAPGGGGLCAVRDISAYVAAQCDGQQTCNPSIESLGPYPCALTPIDCNFNLSTPEDYSSGRVASNNGYCALPFAYGNGPNVAIGGTTLPNSVTPTATLGYTYHGIYTCV